MAAAGRQPDGISQPADPLHPGRRGLAASTWPTDFPTAPGGSLSVLAFGGDQIRYWHDIDSASPAASSFDPLVINIWDARQQSNCWHFPHTFAELSPG
jgi:hypothetical protein